MMQCERQGQGMHGPVQPWPVSTLASLPQRAPRVVASVCANFRKKNFLPPLLGNHLAFHFFLEGGRALSQCQQLQRPVLITLVPIWLRKAPSPGFPFFLGLIKGHISRAVPAP